MKPLSCYKSSAKKLPFFRYQVDFHFAQLILTFYLVLATLKCHGLDYHLVNIWSLSEDFHKILASHDYLQAPAILAPFYLTTWIYPMHSKKGSETECVISNISELSGQKVIYIQQQSTKDFHENIAVQDKGRLILILELFETLVNLLIARTSME